MQMRAKLISVGLLGAAVVLPIDLARADQLGHASWYSLPSNITANGERMNPNELTAAHRSLPFGTKVLVENLANGRSVVVRINDRGPFIGGRIIDLSKAAAASIRMIDSGTAKVRVMTTNGGNAVAALGESTAKAKAKTGAASAAAATADISPAKAKVNVAANKLPKAKSVAAKAKSGTTRVAKRLEARANVTLASTSRRISVRSRVAVSSSGIRAVAYQASSLPGRRTVVAAHAHPYAILGTTPGFMKPGRGRRIS